MDMKRWGAIAVIGACLLATAGCAGDGGGSAEPITLRIGTDDSPGVPAADQIEEFARQVAKLSDGAVKIEPVWHAAGDSEDWDQAVARLVMDGTLEMGLIPARAWDTLAVTSLEPLQAPFLITSTAHLDEVVTSELAEPLMAGLVEADVVGLALFPEGLRRPFGFNGPVLGPADYAGGIVRAPTSAVSSRMYQTLGATTSEGENDPETMLARESSLMLSAGGATVTGNVAFYPKVNVLVIGRAALDGLDEAHRDVLEKAALAARDVVIKDVPSSDQLARDFCASGGTIVLASEQEVADLRAATASVVDEIAAKPGNAQLLAMIRAVMPAGGDEVAPACAPDPDAGSQNVALDGTYRWEMTAKEFRDNGVDDQKFIDINVGVYTWTFADGEWEYVHVDPAGVEWPEEGSYEFDGERLVLRFPDGAPESYRVDVDSDGNLTLTALKVAEHRYEVWATANVWERIR